MERVTVVKTLDGNLSSRPPVFDVSKTNFRDRDASFSSYLRPESDVSQHIAEDSEISIFDAKKYFNESNDPKVMISNRVSPLNINLDSISEQCDLSSAGARFSSASSVDGGYGRNYCTRSFHATPTASSEASWNSQTGLLSNPPGAISVSLRNNAVNHEKNRGPARWLFGRKCPCSGKKSVQVEDKLSSEPQTWRLRLSLNDKSNKVVLSPNPQLPKSKSAPNGTVRAQKRTEQSVAIAAPEMAPISQTQVHRFSPEKHFHTERVLASTTGFTFPILDSSTPIKLVLNGAQPNSGLPLQDPPRDSVESLEVFRPPRENPRLQEPDPRLINKDIQIFTFQTSPKSRVMAAVADEDMASDASSDLFEIESFSTQTTTYPIVGPRRDSLDEAANFNVSRRLSGSTTNGALYCRRSSLDEPMTPSIVPTECYEPSEASIDWSVTTAEGFDRASVTNYSVTALSEFDDMFRHNEVERGGTGGKRRGNGLLSCRCEKAVSVVGPHPQPMKWVPPEGQRGVAASSTTKHVGGRAPTVNKPPLVRSRSARLSLAFAT